MLLTEHLASVVCTHPDLSFIIQQAVKLLSNSRSISIATSTFLSSLMHGENLAPSLIKSA